MAEFDDKLDGVSQSGRHGTDHAAGSVHWRQYGSAVSALSPAAGTNASSNTASGIKRRPALVSNRRAEVTNF
ncbi:MAG: hypothetical protein V8R75_10995 [Oscillospiraceae bacterium]